MDASDVISPSSVMLKSQTGAVWFPSKEEHQFTVIFIFKFPLSDSAPVLLAAGGPIFGPIINIPDVLIRSIIIYLLVFDSH